MKIKRIIAMVSAMAVVATLAVMPSVRAEEQLTGMVIYVAPDGSDFNDGTKTAPLGSMQGARDKIRQLKASSSVPAEGITVVFRGGSYQWNDTLEFTEEDSGTQSGKIVYRSYPGEKAVMEAGMRIPGSEFQSVTDENVLSKWSSAKVKEKIRQIDIKSYVAQLGYTELGDYYPQLYDNYHFAGTYQGQSEEVKAKYGERTGMRRPIYSFDDEQALWLARYPNKSGGWYPDTNPQSRFLQSGEVIKNGGTAEPSAFKYSERRISKYAGHDDVYLFGHMYYYYYHDEVKININSADQTITTAAAMNLGLRPDRDYFIFNIIEELDAPGEYYVDKNTGMMYVYPNGDIDEKTLNVSLLDKEWMITTNNTSNVTFAGLTFENTKGGGVFANGGENISFEYCDFNNMGTTGLQIGTRANIPYTDIGDPSAWAYDKGEGDDWWERQTNFWRKDEYQVRGRNHNVFGCRITNTGRSGIEVAGGSLHKDELSGHRIENSIIENVGLYQRTYAPAVSLNSVYGMTIKDNRIGHTPAAAISGNSAVLTVWGNELYDSMTESYDNGVIYLNYQYPNLDVKFIDNYFHDTPPEHEVKTSASVLSQRAGVAFDNSYGGGIEYTNNVMVNIPKGTWLKDDIIFNNNVIVDSQMPLQVNEGITDSTPTVPDSLTQETIAPLFAYTRYMLGWPIWEDGEIGEEFTKLWTEKYPGVMDWVNIVKSGEAQDKRFCEAKNNLFVNKSVPLHLSVKEIGSLETYNESMLCEMENNVYTDDVSMFVDYENRNYQLTAESSAKYGNTLNLSTTGPKIAAVGADAYADGMAVQMPDKLRDAVILRTESPNAWLNGRITQIDPSNSAVTARVVDERTLVPVRFIAESFGGDVKWDAAARKVTSKLDSKTAELTIDNKDLIIDGEKAAEMDVPAQLIEDSTMVPLRVLCETVMGKKVFWDSIGLIVITNDDIPDASADSDIIKTAYELLGK